MENVKIKNGLILGVALVIISLVLYLIDPRVYLTWETWIGFAAVIYIMYKTAVAVREQKDGVLSFGSAFVAVFVPMAIGLLISSLFSYVLQNYLAPELGDITKEMAIETIEKISGMFGGDVGDEMMEEIENQDYSLTMGKVFLGWMFSVVIGCVPALIVAALTKKSGDFA
ncbi:MAG: DUF4199 domain-containing protein [Saprospiraceae bacterium]|tara:strand:- start:1451 stop:1960 length:510 start_codon:yes stop_codon:yes gene_type:complete